MKIYTETSLRDFNFWAGACGTVEYLKPDEMDTIEEMLEMDGYVPSDTEINDFFWFETDTIAEWLGYKNFEELMERD